MHPYLAELPAVAAASDDPDTQTACILLSLEGDAICAANSLPTGVAVRPERTRRPDKYAFIAHAERQAIARAARLGARLDGGAALLNWFPCASCAGSLIEAGIKILHVKQSAYEIRKSDPRYEFAAAMEMLLEARVAIRWF